VQEDVVAEPAVEDLDGLRSGHAAPPGTGAPELAAGVTDVASFAARPRPPADMMLELSACGIRSAYAPAAGSAPISPVAPSAEPSEPSPPPSDAPAVALSC